MLGYTPSCEQNDWQTGVKNITFPQLTIEFVSEVDSGVEVLIADDAVHESKKNSLIFWIINLQLLHDDLTGVDMLISYLSIGRMVEFTLSKINIKTLILLAFGHRYDFLFV